MPKIHFSDLTVKNLKPGTYFDDKTPAFGLRVGVYRKTWIVLKQPNRTKISLGHYPEVPLMDARRKALLQIASPSDDRKYPSFPEARSEFLAKHGSRLRPLSLYQVTRTLTRHFTWAKAINQITDRDVAIAIDAIDAIDAPSEASHALKDLKTFFNWCVPRYLKSSPCAGIKPKARYTPRSRFLSDKEIVSVWTAAVTIGEQFGPMCQLLISTGQRRNQIASLRWNWIDETERTITFPASVMKGNKEHRIPYADLTASILESVPRGGELLFPARGSNKPTVSQGNIKRRLDKLSGVPDHTLHDLRRTYAVGLQRCGISIEVIETLLAHRSGSFGGIVGIYQRYDFAKEMRAAVQTYETWLSTLVGVSA